MLGHKAQRMAKQLTLQVGIAAEPLFTPIPLKTIKFMSLSDNESKGHIQRWYVCIAS